MGGPRRSSQGRCLLLSRGIVNLSRCGLPSLVQVPYLATHIDGHLAELDINPLGVLPSGQGVKAVDALVLFRGNTTAHGREPDPKVGGER